FVHDVRYTARLADSRLTIEIEIRACGADAVPVAFGFHPYLAPPGGERERWMVALPPMRGLAVDERQIPVGPGQAYTARRFELGQQEFDDGFDSLQPGARFSVVGGGRRIEVALSEGY